MRGGKVLSIPVKAWIFKWEIIYDTKLQETSNIWPTKSKVIFPCMFDDYLGKSYVYRTTFYNVKYQEDLCATINPSKIKYLQNRKQSLKYLCNINSWVFSLQYIIKLTQNKSETRPEFQCLTGFQMLSQKLDHLPTGQWISTVPNSFARLIFARFTS